MVKILDGYLPIDKYNEAKYSVLKPHEMKQITFMKRFYEFIDFELSERYKGYIGRIDILNEIKQDILIFIENHIDKCGLDREYFNELKNKDFVKIDEEGNIDIVGIDLTELNGIRERNRRNINARKNGYSLCNTTKNTV